jgi:hypothetical protein
VAEGFGRPALGGGLEERRGGAVILPILSILSILTRKRGEEKKRKNFLLDLGGLLLRIK